MSGASVAAGEPDDDQRGLQRRWDRWQGRNARSSRRSGIQARIVAAVLLGAIVVLLLMQLLAERVHQIS